MSIITITREWDAFVAEVLAYADTRPDVAISQLFDAERGQPIFALVGATSHDVSVRLVPSQELRARFERLRIRRPPPEDSQPLAIGDRCILNSGGPIMTVINGNDEWVTVAWRAGEKVDGGDFERVMVRRVAP